MLKSQSFQNDVKSRFKKFACSILWGVSLAGVGPLLAQEVDHTRIEQLFSILTSEKNIAPPSMAAAPEVVPGPAMVSAPPPPSSPNGTQQSAAKNIPEVPFDSRLPDTQGCPEGLESFDSALSGVSGIVKSYESAIIDFSKRYDLLDENTMAFQFSGQNSCPDDMRESYSAFLGEIKKLQVTDKIFPTEGLIVCAQKAVTNLQLKMDEIPADAPIADQQKRLNFGNVMAKVSAFDRRATESVQRLVSLEQKRQRLMTGVQNFEASCAAYDSVSFGGGEGLSLYD